MILNYSVSIHQTVTNIECLQLLDIELPNSLLFTFIELRNGQVSRWGMPLGPVVNSINYVIHKGGSFQLIACILSREQRILLLCTCESGYIASQFCGLCLYSREFQGNEQPRDRQAMDP